MLEIFGFHVDAYWVWLGVGLLLTILELATGSLFLLWPAVSALIFALVTYLAPGIPVAGQLFGFAALGIALTFVGRSYFRMKPANAQTDRPLLNRRGAQLAGRQVRALAAFEGGQGAVRLDDSQWAARLADPQAGAVGEGATLRIVAVEGSTLVVEPV